LINEAFVWSCTNGKYEDLVEVAKILKGRKLPDYVSFVIVPASSQIYKKALKEWLIDIFVEAGALVESPNCAKCFGKHMWVAGPESRIISSSNRNYKWMIILYGISCVRWC
jgi:homoaconitase/3-isopropylmalate dehydratase large subunit